MSGVLCDRSVKKKTSGSRDEVVEVIFLFDVTAKCVHKKRKPVTV